MAHVYWQAEDYKPRTSEVKPFTFEHFATGDKIVTKFVFFGRGGKHLWTISALNNVILYPGVTADRRIGEEIACTPIEFHSILVAAAKLKEKNSKFKGVLDVFLLGKKQKCK